MIRVGTKADCRLGGVLIVLAVSMATMQRLLFSWSMVGE